MSLGSDKYKKCLTLMQFIYVYIHKTSLIIFAAASGIGDECIKNIQCEHLLHTNCTDSKCTCTEGYSDYNGTCYEIKGKLIVK